MTPRDSRSIAPPCSRAAFRQLRRQHFDSHDPVEQTHKVMQNIRQLIEEAGGSMEHLCKVVVYLTDPRFREPVYQVMGRWLQGVVPVSTGVVVSALARPEWLVEIDVTARGGGNALGHGMRPRAAERIEYITV